MSNWIGTRAEREWLADFKRIASALERIADVMDSRAESEGIGPRKT